MMPVRKRGESGKRATSRAKTCAQCRASFQRRTRSLVATLALVIVVAACEDSRPPEAADRGSPVSRTERPSADRLSATRKPLDGDVRIELKVTELSGRRVHIHGTTNLPTDTQLMLSVKERTEGGFYGQSKCSVTADGSFQSESFGPANGLKDGTYVANVTMPIARVQPDHVRQIIGAKGENLTGPLVEAGDFGVTASANHVFTIGGAEASRLQEERARERGRQYREWLNKVVSLEKRLERARSNNWLQGDSNTTNLAKWGEFARQFRQDLQSYQKQLMQLEPVGARVMVAAALGDVGNMFDATAFQKQQEYEEATNQYAESLKQLEKLVAEVDATP